MLFDVDANNYSNDWVNLDLHKWQVIWLRFLSNFPIIYSGHQLLRIVFLGFDFLFFCMLKLNKQTLNFVKMEFDTL